MDDGWNTSGPVHNPRLTNYQKTLEGSKADRRRRLKQNFTPAGQQTTYQSQSTILPANSSRLFKCFLVESREIKPYVNEHGWLKRKYNVHASFFRCHVTCPNVSKFTKLTLIASSHLEMRKAEEQLLSFLRNSQLEFKEIPMHHCSLCFKPGHKKQQCHNCSFCGNTDHYRKNCPELSPQESSLPSINVIVTRKRSISEQSFLNSRKRKREFIGNRVWFRRKHENYTAEIENLMKPLGLRGEEKLTVSFDTEGSGDGEMSIGSVHVSGWFGGALGINTIYYAEIKNQFTTNSNMKFTGLQITDHQDGEDFKKVKDNLIKIFSGKRVITQGQADWSAIGISELDRITFDIEAVDLQDLYSGGQHPMGLASLDLFLFKHSPKLRRDDPLNVTAGHSPERDSRVTLQGYRKYILMKETVGFVPNGDEIREMAANGKTICEWIRENINTTVHQSMEIQW